MFISFDNLIKSRIIAANNIINSLLIVAAAVISIIILKSGFSIPQLFLFIAALSFLGLGIQPPTADWGSMVRENATLINYNDITPLLPAAAIAGLTVAVNFVVDWMLHLSSGLRSD